MSRDIQIDFLQYQDELVFKKIDGVIKIFDPIRKKYFVKEPEEIVRQLVLLYLMKEKGVSKNKLAVEKMLVVNERRKRFDILVYNDDTVPYLLVECKAPSVAITDDTFRQISAYNIALKVKYLFVTNGVHSYCCELDYEQQSFEFINEVPSFVVNSGQ